MKLCFFDTETTGKESDDQILQFGAIYGSFDGKKFHEERRINQYINVTKDIHPEAEKIHGINRDMLKSFGYMDDYIDEILGYIKKSDYIIGHNIEFDIGKLQGDCKRIGKKFDWNGIKSICTMKKTIDLVDLPGKKRPKLSELYKHLFGKDFDNAHDAMSDIEATRDCFIKLVRLGEIYFDIDGGDYQTNKLSIKKRLVNMVVIANEEYCPILTKAVMLGDKEMVEYLLNNIVIRNSSYSICQTHIDTRNEVTDPALIEASRLGHKEIIELLLAHGANIEIRDWYGTTALMCASDGGHKEIIELLLAHGANIGAKDNEGRTALMRASASGHKEAIECLLAHGANIEAEDNEGRTALTWTGIGIGGNSKTVECLLEHGANIEAKDNEGNTILMEVCFRYKEELEVFLLNSANIETIETYLLPNLLDNIDRLGNILVTLFSHGANIKVDNEETLSLGNMRTLIGVPFTSGGNGTEEDPFILVRHKDYVKIEYIIMQFLYEGYEFISQALISSGFSEIDAINIKYTKDSSQQQMTIYFNLINNW